MNVLKKARKALKDGLADIIRQFELPLSFPDEVGHRRNL